MTAQTTIEFAKSARDEGMNRAINHADQVHENWSVRVYAAFLEYLRQQKDKFQTEDFREWLGDRLPEPPHKRAFGSITMRAAKAGFIVQVGFAHVKNPKAHRANSAVWVSTIK